MTFQRLQGFTEWYESLSLKGRLQIDARLLRIQDYGHFGDSKDLGSGLAELRWKNGWRVYFVVTENAEGDLMLLLLGGNKNGQSKDIRKARFLIEKYSEGSP